MKTKIFNRLTVRLSRLRDGLSLRGHAGTVSALVLFALSWASCDRSQEDGLCAPSGELCRVPITLKTGLDTEISVKSVADHDDNLVANVWVVQLTEDGTSQLAAPQYVESMQKIGDGYRFTMDLPQRPMKLVFLANTGDPSLLPDTGNSLESLLSLGHAVTDESSLYIDGLAPRSGVWTGTPNALGLTSTVELVRSCATVALNLQASLSEGYEFQLKSVSVKNVPAKSYYLVQAERETLFPSTSEGKVADYAEESFASVNIVTSPQQVNFAIPANLRGTGTATKVEDKGAATAPEGQADYCTYIEITGTYGTNIGGLTGALNAECTYRLYLGENLTDDYNVKPGYKYNLDATIKGANVLDARITVNKSYYGGYESNESYLYTDGAYARWLVTLNNSQPIDTLSLETFNQFLSTYVYNLDVSRGEVVTLNAPITANLAAARITRDTMTNLTTYITITYGALCYCPSWGVGRYDFDFGAGKTDNASTRVKKIAPDDGFLYPPSYWYNGSNLTPMAMMYRSVDPDMQYWGGQTRIRFVRPSVYWH